MKTERKMLIAIVLVAIILFNCLLPVLKVSASTDVKITFESNLYFALKEQFEANGIEAAYIDKQRTIIINEDEIARVTELSLSNYELTDLTGLEVFTNLVTLDLSSNDLTKDSNLDVLSSLNLKLLDLSSNEIEDVSMITNFDEIEIVNLHNQKFDIVNIIDLDTSKESDQITQVTYALPQILSKAGYLQSEWLIEETSGKPYINWSNFDHKNIKVEVALRAGSIYQPYTDMVTLRINISDSTNILYNSDINMFFVVVDSTERGIHIVDENMYKSVKEQLTAGQTVNSDLISHANTTESLRRNLYRRTYDEPQVLVIAINDIINKIQSLDLSNKKIERIDGIEKFVGLEKKLDLSGNYIKSIDKLIELQENQKIEEEKLRERVSEQLKDVAETVDEISQIDLALDEEEEKKQELLNLEKELEENIKKLQNELEKLQDEKTNLETGKVDLENAVADLEREIAALNEDLKKKNEVLAELTKELVDMNSQKATLEKELAKLKEELAGLEANLAAERQKIQDQIDEKQKEIDLKNEEINQKQADISEKQAEIDAKNEEINQKQMELDTKTSTIAIYDVRISEITAEIGEKEEELKKSYEINFNESMLTTEEDIDELVAKAAQEYTEWTVEFTQDDFKRWLISTFAKINAQLQVIAGFITQPETTETDIEASLQELEEVAEGAMYPVPIPCPEELARYLAQEIDLKMSESNLSVLFQTVVSLHEEFVASTDLVIKPLLEERTRLQAEIEAIKAEIETEDTGLSAEKAELIEQKEALEVEKATLKEQKVILESQLSDLNEELANLKDLLANIENADEYKNIQNQIESKKAEIAEKERQISTVQENIDNKEKEIIDCEGEISAVQKEIELKQEEKAEKQAELDKKQSELSAKEAEIVAKMAELAEIVKQLNTNNESITQSEIVISALQLSKEELEAILYGQMRILYDIYNRVDKLASFAISELKMMTEEELGNLKYEEAKALFDSQTQRISDLESNFSNFEALYLIKEFNIATSTTVTTEKVVLNDDGTTTTVTETVSEPIENPISKYYEELNKQTTNWGLGKYLEHLTKFREIDAYFSMMTYCYLVRLFDGLTTCQAYDYINVEIERLEFDGNSANYLIDAKNNYNSICNNYNYSCSGTASLTMLYDIAARIVYSAADINTYVVLPRIKSLDISENLIENIDRVSELTELRRFYAYDNEIVDISTVDWASMTKLKILDLGLNGISDIEPLESLKNIEELYLKQNLIAGKFDFDVSSLEKLKVLDLSENRIDDIENLIQYLTYKARANGYDDIARFLNESSVLDVKFNNQILTMKIDKKFEVNETRRVELPKIFRQIEEIDYANTSFGINSINGNVTNDGKYVMLDTTLEGTFNSSVKVLNTSNIPSLGSGTNCTITYTVGSIIPVAVLVTPDVAEVVIGNEQQFEATVTGEYVTYEGVTWELEGATSPETTLSENGLLKVALDETADVLTVRATSVYDETKSAEVEVTVIKKEVTAVTITPAEATMFGGENKTFTATVEGNNLEENDKNVIWEIYVDKITNENGETVDPTFAEGTNANAAGNKLTLNIGQGETVEKFTIVAKSEFDETKFVEAVVTVGTREVTEVVISPAEVSVETGKTQKFDVTVKGNNLRDEDKGVIYSVIGNTSGNTKVSNDGILTIASNEKSSTIKVRATSVFDDTKSAEAIVRVTEKIVNINLGYEIENEYVVGVETKTPIDVFKEKFAKGYKVVVKDDKTEVTTGYMKTGMFAEVQDEDGNTIEDENGNLLVYEVVVKGDINGDGVADAFDSNIIKAVRNEVGTILDVQKRAADIDNNGDIDLLDSKLLLYHRAEVKDYCLDYTEE